MSPPLIISEAQIDELIGGLRKVLQKLGVMRGLHAIGQNASS